MNDIVIRFLIAALSAVGITFFIYLIIKIITKINPKLGKKLDDWVACL